MRYLLQLLIGFLIIGVLFYLVDFNLFIQSVKETNFVFILLAMLVYAINIFIICTRPKIIFDKLGKKIKYTKVAFAQFAGMLASDITPGRAGFVIFPFLIKKDVPVATSFSAIMSTQVIDFLLKIISSIVGLWIIAYTVQLNSIVLGAALIGIFIVTAFTLLFIVALWSKKSMNLFRFGLRIPFIGRIIARFENQIESFQEESQKIKKLLPKVLLISSIGWFLKGVEWYLLGLAVGINLPFWMFLFLQPLITIVQFVPLTPAGLGLQEGGSILVLVLLGATMEAALLFSFLSRIILILVDLLGVPLLVKKGIQIINGKKNGS